MAYDGTRPLQGRRMLVVEDEYMVALDIADALEADGAIVIGPAATVDDALALIATNAIDAASLDINLNSEKVFPVADVLATRHIPFVFTSGYDAKVVPHQYAAIPRCTKPIFNRDLIKALERCLDQG